MADALAVIWRPGQLLLREIASDGIWREDPNPIKGIPFETPNRFTRLADLETEGDLRQGMATLFEGVEVTLPVWVTLPENWYYGVELEVPSLKTAQLVRDNLTWSVEQRLHGTSNVYSVWIPKKLDAGKVKVFAVRHEISEAIGKACADAGILIAGITPEPVSGRTYNLANCPDLRQAVPLTSGSSAVVKREDAQRRQPRIIKKVASVPPGYLIVAGLLMAGLLVMFIMLPGADPGGKAKPEARHESEAEGHDTLAQAAEHPTPTAEKPAADKLAEGKYSEEPTKPVPAGPPTVISPLTLATKKIPQGATVLLASISPALFRMEVLGLRSTEVWLKELRSIKGLEQIQISGNYQSTAGAVTIFRLDKPGWKVATGSRQVELWDKIAGSAGLKAKGRTATGPLQGALTSVDAVWANPSGFSKIYFALDGSQYRVTVQ